jgi:hypothetical protein
MAKLNMKNVTEEINDKHLKPWSELCKVCAPPSLPSSSSRRSVPPFGCVWLTASLPVLQAHGITNTPLTPYLDQELLYNNSLSVDGSKIESTGYASLCSTFTFPLHTKHLPDSPPCSFRAQLHV